MPSVPYTEVPYLKEYDEELHFNYPSEAERQKIEQLEQRREYQRSGSETAETLARLREDNESATKEFRWSEQEELKRLRLGRTMRDYEFLRRLRTLIDARFGGMSRHGLWKLEVLMPTATGGAWQFVCGLQAGIMPEYSTMYFDAHNLPTSEMYRGWRTVLLRLIITGVVSEQDADRVFGEARGPEARRYREQLHTYRNRHFN